MSSQTYSVLSVIFAIASFLLIFILGLRSSLLKESSEPGKPYSFHKFQLWLWTLILCPSFALYWGWADPHQPFINQTALILLGIAIASTATAEVINTANKTSPNRTPTLKAVDLGTTGFWSDILKDDTGQLSIGRLQHLVFTFIFAGIYICSFFPNMVYPDFASNSFILMGISSGGFLLGKGLNK